MSHDGGIGGRRLDCIFGCGGNDCLKHYLVCETFWTLIASASNSSINVIYAPLHQRLCIADFHEQDISRCVVAFQAYHALRNDYTRLIDDAESTSNYDLVIDTAYQLLRYFAQECHLT